MSVHLGTPGWTLLAMTSLYVIEMSDRQLAMLHYVRQLEDGQGRELGYI